ncbi:MAG TPA: hypothetical protein VKY74_08940 [Chloroflexia bacterium]|nr:hypothetical protein [Chloroflexia bacterium]
MLDLTSYGDIVHTHRGQGQITFPLGGRIQCYFALAEYSTGKRLLTCTGRFPKAGYASWERLVSQYQVDPHLPAAQKRWLAERYEGRTDDDRQLKIQQMFLIHAQASDIAQKTLTLQMQFECQDATLLP